MTPAAFPPRRRRTRLLAVLAATVLAGLVALAPAAHAAGPAAGGCAWRATADRLAAALAGRTDAQAQRLRTALDGALRAAACPTAPVSGAAPAASGSGVRPYFQKADWLWEPIPANPVLDPDSASMAAALRAGDHIADTDSFGVTMVEATPDTPRHQVSTTASWCAQPLAGVPIPDGTPIPSGSDGHITILDRAQGLVHSLWTTQHQGGPWSAGCGSSVPLDGDGRETGAATSTGSDISRWAAVIRHDEIASGTIGHALFFSTNMARAGECRYPANKTDGGNFSSSSVTIPEGARVQLDPTVNVDGLQPGARAIAKALQTYGGYVGDNGGARMAFLFERGDYSSLALSGDFAPITLPWDKLRVLANSTGTSQSAGTCGGGQ